MSELKNLKDDYNNIEIPDNLETVINKAIKKKESSLRRNSVMKSFGITLAAFFILFTITVNISPNVAKAMSNVPILGQLVKLITKEDLTYEDTNHKVNVEIPEVEGLDNSTLQASLNEKYLETNTQLYQDFLNKIGENELSPQKLALFKEYQIIVQTEDFLVVKAVTTEIAASGTESAVFDNIDLKNQMIISLPSLFIDDSYIDIISKNIIDQMKERMAKEDGSMFFLAENGDIGGFDKIKPDQNFYINADGKLVISFDEYEVAPGVMGMVEFTIPTEVIQNVLVSNNYIK